MALDDMRCDNYIPSYGAMEDVIMPERPVPSGPPRVQEETLADDNTGTANVPEEQVSELIPSSPQGLENGGFKTGSLSTV